MAVSLICLQTLNLNITHSFKSFRPNKSLKLICDPIPSHRVELTVCYLKGYEVIVICVNSISERGIDGLPSQGI